MVFGTVSLSPADNAVRTVWSRPRDGNQTVLTEGMEKLGMQLFPWTDAPLWPPSAPPGSCAHAMICTPRRARALSCQRNTAQWHHGNA